MKERLAGFWSRYGFYVSVGGFVVILAVSALGIRRNIENRYATPPTAEQVGYAPEFVESIDDVAPTPEPTPEAAPRPELSWPLNAADGERIITPYSEGEPVYFAPIGQWAIHQGVDISGAQGEVVVAAADGVVAAAYSDPMLGYTVEINHDHGYTTRYASLNTINVVSVGDKVARGAPVGGVGVSAAAESDLPPHLHFEVLIGGSAVDPASVIGEY